MKRIPVSEVGAGQEYIHGGQVYRRATDAEVVKHMCYPMLKRRPDLVLAYALEEDGGKMPASFAPQEHVVLKRGKRRGSSA